MVLANSLEPVVVFAFEIVHDAQQVLGNADISPFINLLLEYQDCKGITNFLPFCDSHSLIPPILELDCLIVCIHSIRETISLAIPITIY